MDAISLDPTEWHCKRNRFTAGAFSTSKARKGGYTYGNSGGNNGMLYFIVGALCVVVAAGAFVMFGGHVSAPNQAKSIDVKVEVPKK